MNVSKPFLKSPKSEATWFKLRGRIRDFTVLFFQGLSLLITKKKQRKLSPFYVLGIMLSTLNLSYVVKFVKSSAHPLINMIPTKKEKKMP